MSRWLAKTLSKRNITDTEEKKDGRGESDGSEDHGSDADFYDLHNHESPVKAPKPPTLTRKNSGIASGKLSSPSPSPRNSSRQAGPIIAPLTAKSLSRINSGINSGGISSSHSGEYGAPGGHGMPSLQLQRTGSMKSILSSPGLNGNRNSLGTPRTSFLLQNSTVIGGGGLYGSPTGGLTPAPPTPLSPPFQQQQYNSAPAIHSLMSSSFDGAMNQSFDGLMMPNQHLNTPLSASLNIPNMMMPSSNNIMPTPMGNKMPSPMNNMMPSPLNNMMSSPMNNMMQPIPNSMLGTNPMLAQNQMTQPMMTGTGYIDPMMSTNMLGAAPSMMMDPNTGAMYMAQPPASPYGLKAQASSHYYGTTTTDHGLEAALRQSMLESQIPAWVSNPVPPVASREALLRQENDAMLERAIQLSLSETTIQRERQENRSRVLRETNDRALEDAIRASLTEYQHQLAPKPRPNDPIEQANEKALQEAILKSMQVDKVKTTSSSTAVTSTAVFNAAHNSNAHTSHHQHSDASADQAIFANLSSSSGGSHKSLTARTQSFTTKTIVHNEATLSIRKRSHVNVLNAGPDLHNSSHQQPHSQYQQYQHHQFTDSEYVHQGAQRQPQDRRGHDSAPLPPQSSALPPASAMSGRKSSSRQSHPYHPGPFPDEPPPTIPYYQVQYQQIIKNANNADRHNNSHHQQLPQDQDYDHQDDYHRGQPFDSDLQYRQGQYDRQMRPHGPGEGTMPHQNYPNQYQQQPPPNEFDEEYEEGLYPPAPSVDELQHHNKNTGAHVYQHHHMHHQRSAHGSNGRQLPFETSLSRDDQEVYDEGEGNYPSNDVHMQYQSQYGQPQYQEYNEHVEHHHHHYIQHQQGHQYHMPPHPSHERSAPQHYEQPPWGLPPSMQQPPAHNSPHNQEKQQQQQQQQHHHHHHHHYQQESQYQVYHQVRPEDEEEDEDEVEVIANMDELSPHIDTHVNTHHMGPHHQKPVRVPSLRPMYPADEFADPAYQTHSSPHTPHVDPHVNTHHVGPHHMPPVHVASTADIVAYSSAEEDEDDRSDTSRMLSQHQEHPESRRPSQQLSSPHSDHETRGGRSGVVDSAVKTRRPNVLDVHLARKNSLGNMLPVHHQQQLQQLPNQNEDVVQLSADSAESDQERDILRRHNSYHQQQLQQQTQSEVVTSVTTTTTTSNSTLRASSAAAVKGNPLLLSNKSLQRKASANNMANNCGQNQVPEDMSPMIPHSQQSSADEHKNRTFQHPKSTHDEEDHHLTDANHYASTVATTNITGPAGAMRSSFFSRTAMLQTLESESMDFDAPVESLKIHRSFIRPSGVRPI